MMMMMKQESSVGWMGGQGDLSQFFSKAVSLTFTFCCPIYQCHTCCLIHLCLHATPGCKRHISRRWGKWSWFICQQGNWFTTMWQRQGSKIRHLTAFGGRAQYAEHFQIKTWETAIRFFFYRTFSSMKILHAHIQQVCGFELMHYKHFYKENFSLDCSVNLSHFSFIRQYVHLLGVEIYILAKRDDDILWLNCCWNIAHLDKLLPLRQQKPPGLFVAMDVGAEFGLYFVSLTRADFSKELLEAPFQALIKDRW